MSRSGRLLVLSSVVLVVLAACAGAEVPGDVDGEGAAVVEVFTPYQGAEADAFREVLGAFSERTGIPTQHVGTVEFARRLPERVRAGDVPDVALIPQPSIVDELARDDHLTTLDGTSVVVGDTFIPGAERFGMVDGRRVAVPFRLALKSLVWYPPAAFRDAGYQVPRTWRELLDLTERIANDGVAPWCLGMESFGATGWVGTDWVEDLVLRMHGEAVYDDWAAGRLAFTSPPIAGAFAQFGRIALVERRVRGGSRAILATPALEAIAPMFEDPPGCLLSRQASFQEAALPDGVTIGPDADVDVFVLPDIEAGPAPLVVAGEMAGAFDDRAEVLELMAYLADPAGARPWAQRGGFVSPHSTFDPTAYGATFDRAVGGLVADAALVRFDASDQMPAPVGTGTFWLGMVEYVSGTPLPTVLAEIQAGYDLVKADGRPRSGPE